MDDKHTAFLRSAFPAGTMYTYDEIEVLRKQENEMEMVNTKVFEYCIIDWDDEGNSVLIVGPALITVDAKETHANIALVRIGQLHSTEITVTSEVQLRPFC